MIAGTAQSADPPIKEKSRGFSRQGCYSSEEGLSKLSREKYFLIPYEKLLYPINVKICKRLKRWLVEQLFSLVLEKAFPNLGDLDDSIPCKHNVSS